MAMKKLLVRRTCHLLTNRKPADRGFRRRSYDWHNFQTLFSFQKAWHGLKARRVHLLLHDEQADLDVQLLDIAVPLPVTRALIQPPLLSWNLEYCRIPQLPIVSACGPAARGPTSTKASPLVRKDPHREFARAVPESAANQAHAPPLLGPQDQRRKQIGIRPDPPGAAIFRKQFSAAGGSMWQRKLLATTMS